MIHLKNFISFINEGAWYEGEEEARKVFLSLKNDPNNPNELLKTSEPNGKNYNIRGTRGVAPIKVYYGLYPKTKYKAEDPESERAKNNIMDPLKKAEEGKFYMAPGEKMEDFLEYTLLKNIKSDIDYVVRIGSSADLVNVMSKSLSNIYPNALLIDINKIKYESGEDAVDTDEYNKKVARELAIDRGINKKTGEPLPRHSRTQDFVRAWINARNNDLLQLIANGKDPWFHIKSSGIQGGIRGSLRPKYDTASEAFINAVHHCAFGDENGNLGKMILIDDNTQQGTDFKNISNKILEILAGIIDITKNNTEEVLKGQEILAKIGSSYKAKIINNNLDKQLDNIEKEAIDNIQNNIFGYVLYNFNKDAEEKAFADEDIRDILVEVAKVLVNNNINIESYKAKGIADTIKSNSSYGIKRYEYLSRYSVGLTNDNYEELFNAIIKEVVDKLEAKTTDSRETLEEKVKKVFYKYEHIILPLKDAVKLKINTKPKYPELAYLKNGTKVINKRAGNEGTLVDVNHGAGIAHVLLADGRKTLPLDLKILLNIWEILN